jgi:hypothetical protein
MMIMFAFKLLFYVLMTVPFSCFQLHLSLCCALRDGNSREVKLRIAVLFSKLFGALLF